MMRDNIDAKADGDITVDEYGTVLNSPATFAWIAERLNEEMSVILAWTDEAGTQLDVLLVRYPMQVGHLQRGMSSHTDLFVALSHFGMFGFEVNDIEKHPGYVGEKLNLGTTPNETTVKLAELINGVIKELQA